MMGKDFFVLRGALNEMSTWVCTLRMGEEGRGREAGNCVRIYTVHRRE